MKLIVLAFVFNFILNCWPKTNIIIISFVQAYISLGRIRDFLEIEETDDKNKELIKEQGNAVKI